MLNASQNLTAAALREEAYVPVWRNVRVMNVLLMAATVALFCMYLTLNAKAAQKGFEIRTIEKRIVALQDERQKLNISVVTNQSMQALDGQISGLGLVPVTAIEYISGGAGAVAVR